MRRSYVVLIVCLLAVVSGWWLWTRQLAGPVSAPNLTGKTPVAPATADSSSTNGSATAGSQISTLNTNRLAFRLANTTNSIRQLEKAPHAILLANAFIDTDMPLDLNIPPQLKAPANPGAYIVQARGLTDGRFRAALAAAGARIVSYIPNNAYLVRAEARGANLLAQDALVQAVLPYEPYYKMQSTLLGLAVKQQPLPPGVALDLGLFATDAATTETQLKDLGAKIIGRDRSAFGPMLRVLAPENWLPLAQVPGVQIVEPSHTRMLANDLSRVTAGISPDTTSPATNDYQVAGQVLDGHNVLVAVNDTGVDATHPAFTATGTAAGGPSGPTRVTGLNPIDLVDTNGHGTFVAGIIAGNGAASYGGSYTNVGVYAEGSVSNADFRGKAPLANMFSLTYGNSDYTMQTNAAVVGALISNNSWDNGDPNYDLAAASYDAATRDALPFSTGSQPVLFVFSAGNGGNGSDDGTEGIGDTIMSPGTAKNVITVGALEQFRYITNLVTYFTAASGTNAASSNQVAYWQPKTDSGNQIANYSSRGNVGIGTEGNNGRFKPDVVSPGTFIVSTSDQFDHEWDTNAYYNPTNYQTTTYTFQVVDTNGLVYYNVAVPPNAVAVNISISPNRLSPNPFPANLPIYARKVTYPTMNNYDILTMRDGLSIPPDSGGAMSGLPAILGNGFAFAVGSTNSSPINYNLTVQVQVTNYLGNLEQVLEGMNDALGGYYRYESGTSLAAADVSGVLALIQDYFTNSLQQTPSPALLKALLINGSRSLLGYGLAFTNGVNDQGWGLDNIQSCVPAGGLFSATDGSTMGSSFFVDQSPTNALATGDSRTFKITINTNEFANYLNLQATLVWTDPPGDPAAAIKLVNNLDLIVTNLDTGEVYFGNDISAGFNSPWVTNSTPNLDSINNVESVLLELPLAGNYTVTVVGRAVNVNAVTAQLYDNITGLYAPNVVQDYALVVSIGEGELANAFTVAPLPSPNGIVGNPTGDQNITVVTTTNTPLFNQFAGASSPLLGTNTLPLGNNTVWGPNGIVTIGQTNQWHFYIVTNTGPGVDYTNAAFITFDVATLSIPRMGTLDPLGIANATRPEADIDLYVSLDASLTNLNPVAISNCLAGVNNSRVSLGQGGTEFVVYTNSQSIASGAPTVYYIGVKSEDRMAAEYAFLPVFTSEPFSAIDQNGNQIVHGMLLPQYVPDGNNARPGITNVFALAISQMVVEKVTVTNLNEHQNFGDLFGVLTLSGKQQHVVLNNHDGFGNTFGTRPRVYDDSRNRPQGTTNSDGPGTLVNFRRMELPGLFILGEMDNSRTMTGRVSTLDLVIQPHRNLKQPGVIVAVPPGGWFVDYVDVPAGYTNLTFAATNVTSPLGFPPIQMYEKFGNDPTLTDYDQRADLTNYPPNLTVNPGNTISVGPPLPMGQYFVGLYNPGTTEQRVYISATLGVDASVSDVFNYTSGSGQILPDDAVSGSVITVPNTVTQIVASVNVGLVMQSPRISDYTFTLVSPTGQRVLLMENRGIGDTNGAGLTYVYTNILNTTATGNGLPSTNYLPVDPLGGNVPITFNFYTVPDRMTVYDTTNSALFDPNGSDLLLDTGFTNNVPFGGGAQNTYPITLNVPYPPGVSNITIIMNQNGNPYSVSGDAWFYTAGAPMTNYQYLMFTDDTNLADVPIKFAQPPFNFTALSSNYNLGDFDQVFPTNYLGPTNIGDVFGGWNVPTNVVTYTTIVTNGQFATQTNVLNLTNNLVSVFTDPFTALTGDTGGSNVLALARGTITRSLATVPGKMYSVTFWYRGPGIAGWWRGEGNASDSSDPENLNNNGSLIGQFTFPAGEVSQAFGLQNYGMPYLFAGTNSYVQVPASPSLNVGAGGGFTVEGWINPTNLTRPQPLAEWLARVPTNAAVTNIVIVQGPVLNPANSHYYYLLASTNWTVSEQWAQRLGGHLATVETANEENWIYDTFTAYGTLNRSLWIGFTNNGPTTPFFWSSGLNSSTYTNWMPGLPAAQATRATDRYTAIMGPTNAFPGLWNLVGDNRTINRTAPTLPVFGVVEVSTIPTNGVQFWLSGTNGTPATNYLQGSLYANIVDTNYVSHEIFSQTNLLTNNVYQHIALTYNTNTGVAALYLNGTNVATTNLGVFMPKTDGDLLLGWDMTLYTNNFYGGQMDEMSLYSRALSAAEISAIYHVSADTTNRLIGKFDPTVTPAVGLSEALVSFGSSSNVIFGLNNQWSQNSFTFTAASNSMPLTISGIEPGILLDDFAVSEAPRTNLYYLPEQALASLGGSAAAGDWMLQIWDNRVGAFVTNVNQLVNWQLSLVLVSNAVVAASLSPQTPLSSTVPAGQIVYYSVTVPIWAHSATNILVSSTQPVDLLFNQTNPPNGFGVNDITMLSGQTSGAGSPILVTGGTPPLLPGQTYYLGVRNTGSRAAAVVLEVDYDILGLTNGVPFTAVLNTNEYNSLRYFSFDVSSNAYEATFQLLKLNGNADLVVRKGVPLPTLTSSSYGSFSVSNLEENIYVLTNSDPVPLSAGRWYLGVVKRGTGVVNFSVLAKELDFDSANNVPAIINLTNGVPFNWTAGPGADLTNFFHFAVTNLIVRGVTNFGLRFELYNQTGNGDLTVQSNLPPFAPPFYQSSLNNGRNPELILIYTNNVLTNLVADWYLGVPNREVTNISYTILAVMETNLYFPAFPDAQGAGRSALGGKFGDVYHVTTLADSGPGSLRAGINSTNSRTVIFDVGGDITLLSPLIITNSNLTIAGQTAPGGITLAGNQTALQSAHEVIVRDVRFRPNSGSQTLSAVWSSGFEGASVPGLTVNAGSYFGEGWLVSSGSIDLMSNASEAYAGINFVDINGFGSPGTISTNVTTVAGKTYTLSFAYSQNPDGVLSSGGPLPASVNVLQNANLLGTITVNSTNTSWSTLKWAVTTFTFRATAALTQIQFASQTAGSYGVLLDAVSLSTNTPGVATFADSLQVLNSSNVIMDHVSASWSAKNLVSVLNSSNVTVQWSIIADSLYDGVSALGAGSLLRYGNGGLSFHHNLYADNYTGSPRFGDNLSLDFVNNVIYNWGVRSGLTGGTNDLDFSTSGGTNLLNYVCNYLIAGPDTALFAPNNYNITNIAFFGGVTNAIIANWFYQTNNFIDSDTNRVLNGANTGWGMFTNHYTPFSHGFPMPPVPVDEAFQGYEKVLDFAGVNLSQRDSVDTNIITGVRYQTGRLTISTSTSVSQNSGLVAWWKGEGNALDSVGGNNGTLMNGAGFGVGEVNQAFNLNGVNQYIWVQPVNSALDVGPGAGFTFEGWINPTTLSQNLPIFEYERRLGGVGTDLGVYLYASQAGFPGQLIFNIQDTGGNAHLYQTPASVITTGAWQHVALTYDRASGLATLYRNGTVAGTPQGIGTFIPQTSFTNLVLGARTISGSAANPPDKFAGLLDELSFYNRALSASEITAIYNAGSAGKTTNAPVTPFAPTYLDTDQDGTPDFWEATFGTDRYAPNNNNDRDGDGYTDLEEYNNWLAAPHAVTTVTNPVAVNLNQVCGQSGRLAFGLTNNIHGFVYLTNIWGSVTNTTYFSNSFAIFTPTNNVGSGTNYSGYASFSLYVTNLDTLGYFGPVPVSVVVSSVPIVTNAPPVIHELTSGVASNLCNSAGSDFFHITITTNDFGALFELDNRSGPMSLVLRYGLPLPTLSSYDYFTNLPAPPATEQIAVLTNSTPVPLQPGDWYMAAVNVNSNGTVCYSAKITKLSNLVPPVFFFPTNTFATNLIETLPLAISCVATDLDTPPLPLAYAIVSGPSGMYVSNNAIYWTPSEAQGPSTNTVLVSVSNGAFAVTNSFTITVAESNLPPVLPALPNQLVIMPGALLVTNAAFDPDVPINPLTYTLLAAPVGATMDTNGIIAWTPTPAQSGTNYLFTTMVTDTNPWAINAKSLSATNSFITVVLPGIPPGGPETNVVPPNGINWFAISVPTNAIFATNTLIFSSLPVNLWFSTNLPPTLTNGADAVLLTNRTSGVSVLSTNLATAPTNIVPGGVYFLGVQNLNLVAATNAIRVDFALATAAPVLPTIPVQIVTAGETLVVTNTASDSNPGATLVYYLTNSPAGAVISANGIITWPTTTNIAPTNVFITTVVIDTSSNLRATNSFLVVVLPGLVDDQPQTNVVAPNTIQWFKINVPARADLASNFLLFATAPVNLWYSTNAPPSITNAADAELLTNATSGLRVINTTAAPLLVPGWRYFLGVQNTNSFPVTNAVKVKFHLVPTPPVSISIVQTNRGGVNGYLITWFAPTNYQFHLQWTPTLAPPRWTNFNGVISFTSYLNATNSQFQYFDDGSQTGGFNSPRFYRLLLLNSPTNTAPFFLSNPLLLYAAPLVPFVFTNVASDWDIPPQGLTYSLTNSLADTNVVINSVSGVVTWTPTVSQLGLTNFLTVFVTDSGVPAKTATDTFAVLVSTNIPAAPPFGSVASGPGGVTFRWVAPTNQQFQIRWTTNLAPINWHVFPNVITSSTTNFVFVDTNAPWLRKFYQLILLP